MRSITAQIERAGFSINDKKTRMQTRRERQVVTGLVVNKKVNINRQFYRKTRAMAHTLYTQGRFEINGNSATIDQLEGRFSFIDQVDRHNREKNEGTVKLNAHEKQYQKFLFYKYFFASDAPVILTEGISDHFYLKASLKALYKNYPNLITLNDNKFHFKVKLVNRSRRMERLFRMSKDGGGDSFSYLYNCFTGGRDATNYFEKFTKICKCGPKFPTIILLDNESSPGKPLRKFINGLKNSGARNIDDINSELKSNLYSLLVENSKFYILTLPLPDGRRECEMEDLFCSTCFDNCFGGRKFD